MPTTTERVDDIAVVLLAPTIDTRASIEFDRQVASALDAGVRRFVIDCSHATLITSAGLRVLLLLARRTAGDGGLALCAVNDHVRTLLDISGLTRHFTIVATRKDAVARLHGSRDRDPAQPRREGSAISEAVLRILGPDSNAVTGAAPDAPAGRLGRVSPLTARVTDLLRLKGGRRA